MKHISIYCSAVIALLLLASCAKEEFNNPNYDPETKSVLTNFVFNVSTASNVRTKQSAAATQATDQTTFRGIRDAKLMAYAQDADNKILAVDATAPKLYDLSEVASPATLSSTDSRRVIEMSLPLKTNTLLFYGRALEGTTAYDGYTLKDCYGYMDTYNVTATAGSADFSMGSRLEASKKTDFYAVEKLLAGILSVTMNTNLAGDHHVAISGTAAPGDAVKPYKFDVAADEYPTTLTWADYANADGKSPVTPADDLYPLEVKLANLYSQMVTINTGGGELRAASGDAIIKTVTDLWTVINAVRCADPFNEEEAVAKYLANSIHIRLSKYFTASVPSDGAPVTDVAFLHMADESGEDGLLTNFKSAYEVADRPATSATTDWPTETELSNISAVSLSDFPFNFNLPRGASHMGFNKTRKVFYYPSTFNTSGMQGAMEGGDFNAESYFYPAELVYFGNSPVRTSDTEHKVSDYPTGSSAWSTAASWSSDWNGAAVKASTRSVAMKYDINYGTALLASSVRYGVGTLKDNNRAVQAARQNVDLSNETQAAAFAEQDKEINVTANSFKFTGIIIGGQSKHVGWDFLPLAVGSTPKYIYGFVYDKAIPVDSQTIPAYSTDPTVHSEPNYTMVFDNFKAASVSSGIYTADTQDKVYVALEFLNNSGYDFYGNHNLIKNGGYFYLIAELDPATVDDPAWPASGYVLPPYKADGTSNQVKRVFMQDYCTTAVFKLGVNSLKHAYLTVPDLRAGSLTLGLSVDVNWSTGLDFEDVILGGN